MHTYLVSHYLDAARDVSPDKPAVICGTDEVSYANLCASANQLAHALLDAGLQRQDRVLICLPRSTASITTMLATLKADAIYVPVDADTPAARLSQILVDCEPAAIIGNQNTWSKLLPILSDLGTDPILVDGSDVDGNDAPSELDTYAGQVIARQHLADADATDPVYRNIDLDIAYILYTSGSTGTPKGVTISHRNILDYIQWAVVKFQISPADRILGTAPFHFDMSTFDVYASLHAGATLVVASKMDLLFPSKLMRLMENQQITIWKGVSFLLSYLVQTGNVKPETIPTVRHILFGGEVLPTKHLIQWMETYPNKQFTNIYGPTEATGASTFYSLDDIPNEPSQGVPIGQPCGNTETLLLDEAGNQVAPGDVGELYIRGSSLSPGYWRDLQKTADAFVSQSTKKQLRRPSPLSDRRLGSYQ